MWPWEHLAVGYLVYSPLVRAATGDPPADGPALWFALGTMAPDLVDKPLAWSLGVLPSGTSLAHSVFVAVPAGVVAVLVARRRGHGAAGVGFAVGYLLHLPGDVVYPALVGGSPAPGAVLWPVVPTGGGGGATPGLARETLANAAVLLRVLSGPRGAAYLLVAVVVFVAATGLWWADGRPGLEPLQTRVRRWTVPER